MKIRIPVLGLVLLLTLPCIIAQSKNDFLYGGSKTYSTDATRMGRDMLAIEQEYGSSNPVVIMVPKDKMDKEIALNRDLKNLDYVTSVISYVNTADAAIPADFLPTEEVSKLYSENYSRFVVTLTAEEGDGIWDTQVKNMLEISQKYYGKDVRMAGDLASTGDLKDTITQDNSRVNALAIGFVFLILLINFRSVSIPFILTLVIETSIWMNLAVPYFMSTQLHYITYLIISSVQLGATIDYAILFTNRYMEMRKYLPKREAAQKTIQVCILSIFTSASILAIAGLILGKVSTNLVLSQLGTLIGRGAMISFLLVMIILPALLMMLDGVIQKTTLQTKFYKQEKAGRVPNLIIGRQLDSETEEAKRHE